ncbi:hypothetical protein SAMN04489732_106325 [Amycolatopsis saalfeldensis]|uniref:Uncharacterized protein n=1 Tax=Amycolatopsis saalfeldensis TaxID=394193 RepID=A0A1H8X5X2_9PSEU|nr:hypothetical protein SAMN04489732_106325 [Amycolatopsis saalfeldensis]
MVNSPSRSPKCAVSKRAAVAWTAGPGRVASLAVTLSVRRLPDRVKVITRSTSTPSAHNQYRHGPGAQIEISHGVTPKPTCATGQSTSTRAPSPRCSQIRSDSTRTAT